eukprot:4449274-Pyramimonas_sp.AAC.1
MGVAIDPIRGYLTRENTLLDWIEHVRCRRVMNAGVWWGASTRVLVSASMARWPPPPPSTGARALG